MNINTEKEDQWMAIEYLTGFKRNRNESYLEY